MSVFIFYLEINKNHLTWNYFLFSYFVLSEKNNKYYYTDVNRPNSNEIRTLSFHLVYIVDTTGSYYSFISLLLRNSWENITRIWTFIFFSLLIDQCIAFNQQTLLFFVVRNLSKSCLTGSDAATFVVHIK